MARPLVVLAVGGLAISAICLTLASSFGGSSLPGGGYFALFGGRCGPEPKGDETATSKEFAWDGGASVNINIRADVHYRPGPSRQVIVRGAPETLRHLRVEDGVIDFDCYWSGGNGGALDVTLPGSAMRSFAINGSGHLFLDNIHQDVLEIGIHGNGDVSGNGEAERLDLVIAGSGAADLGHLSVRRLNTVIAGSGDADVAPRDRAELVIAGSGNVRLHSQPKQLHSKVVGSGRIISAPETSI